MLRIGVTDPRAPTAAARGLEVQDLFTASLDELRATHRGTLPAHFGPVVGQRA